VPTTTTLLVPFYVGEKEVENIAAFIASFNPEMPYSLLVFPPDFYMHNLPINPLAKAPTISLLETLQF
jgi:pyruvate formate lyase activating enzyme